MISIFLSPRSTFVVRMRDGSPGRVEGWPVGGHCWQGLSELILMLDATLRVELMNAGDPWTRPRSDEITAISRSGREADRIFAVNDEMNMLERCSLSIQKRSLRAAALPLLRWLDWLGDPDLGVVDGQTERSSQLIARQLQSSDVNTKDTPT